MIVINRNQCGITMMSFQSRKMRFVAASGDSRLARPDDKNRTSRIQLRSNRAFRVLKTNLQKADNHLQCRNFRYVTGCEVCCCADECLKRGRIRTVGFTTANKRSGHRSYNVNIGAGAQQTVASGLQIAPLVIQTISPTLSTASPFTTTPSPSLQAAILFEVSAEYAKSCGR